MRVWNKKALFINDLKFNNVILESYAFLCWMLNSWWIIDVMFTKSFLWQLVSVFVTVTVTNSPVALDFIQGAPPGTHDAAEPESIISTDRSLHLDSSLSLVYRAGVCVSVVPAVYGSPGVCRDPTTRVVPFDWSPVSKIILSWHRVHLRTVCLEEDEGSRDDEKYFHLVGSHWGQVWRPTEYICYKQIRHYIFCNNDLILWRLTFS